MRTLLVSILLLSSLHAAHFGGVERISTDQRIAASQNAVAAAPQDPAALDGLAATYLQKMRETSDFGYVEKAEKLVAKVLAAHPGDYEARILDTEIELNRHHFKQVVQNSERLSETAPEDARTWGMMGDALMEIGDYDRAASAYEQMVMLRPGLSSYNRVAWYRFVTGDAEGGISAMRQAVHAAGAAPENLAWCLVDLGHMYFKTGRLDEAQATYRAALDTFPGYHPAYAGLGRVYAARHQIAGAIGNYRRAQSIVPLPEYAGALRSLFVAQHNATEAHYQDALLDVIDQLARATAEKTNRSLAVVFADENRHLDRALELARSELNFRQDVYTYDALAWVLYRNRRYREAQEAAGKALAQATPEPTFYFHAGMIAVALQQPEGARKLLAQSLTLNAAFDPEQAAEAAAALDALK
jgi:tetratricopeptide (TPR) repeat protein